MTRWLAVFVLLLAPAAAAEHPPTMPQRDVDVTYRLLQTSPGAPALMQRHRWSVSTGRLRVDPPTPGIYMIVDYRAKRMAVVKPADRAVLDVASADQGPPGAYTQRDAGSVAGLPCTNWQTADAGGRDTVLCLTADGVMLRASHGEHVLLEAVAVSYGAQDPAAFIPPDGFQHVSGDKR